MKKTAIPAKKISEPRNGVKEGSPGEGSPGGATHPWVEKDLAGIAVKNRSAYRRILLKLSGEILMGGQGFGVDFKALQQTADCLVRIHEEKVELGIVIGGGNIFRGIDLKQLGLPRTPADQMGMLATLMNGLALQQALALKGLSAKVLSALDCPKIVESYQWGKALDYLKDGNIVIFTGGTGNPYFTTDTAAALRASEIEADILLKATKVDGIYDKDPLKWDDAKKFETIRYSEMLAEKLKVMDATAVALCQSSQIPIFVFNMRRLVEGSIGDLLSDLRHGTLVHN